MEINVEGKESETHSRTPREKTCRELGVVEVAPKKAEPLEPT